MCYSTDLSLSLLVTGDPKNPEQLKTRRARREMGKARAASSRQQGGTEP